MAIHCLGSINIDRRYRIRHTPELGDVVTAEDYETGLGGRGANQAMAAAAAGAEVRMTGGVGADGLWTITALQDRGVDTTNIQTLDVATGHAVILTEASGESRTIVHGGANQAIGGAMIEAALSVARAGDWWLTQNETSMVRDSLARAKERKLRTAHSAAPFSPEAVAAILDHVDVLAVNEAEAMALAGHLHCSINALPVPNLLVTRGASGARWRGPDRVTVTLPAFTVSAVDTTGAGDIFLGYCLAALDMREDIRTAMQLGAAAAAISVTRSGAAASIPSRPTVETFLRARES